MLGTLESSILPSSGRTGVSSYRVTFGVHRRTDLLLWYFWITCAKDNLCRPPQPFLPQTDMLSYRERHLVSTTYCYLQKTEQNCRMSPVVLSTSSLGQWLLQRSADCLHVSSCLPLQPKRILHKEFWCLLRNWMVDGRIPISVNPHSWEMVLGLIKAERVVC